MPPEILTMNMMLLKTLSRSYMEVSANLITEITTSVNIIFHRSIKTHIAPHFKDGY